MHTKFSQPHALSVLSWLFFWLHLTQTSGHPVHHTLRKHQTRDSLLLELISGVCHFIPPSVRTWAVQMEDVCVSTVPSAPIQAIQKYRVNWVQMSFSISESGNPMTSGSVENKVWIQSTPKFPVPLTELLWVIRPSVQYPNNPRRSFVAQPVCVRTSSKHLSFTTPIKSP